MIQYSINNFQCQIYETICSDHKPIFINVCPHNINLNQNFSDDNKTITAKPTKLPIADIKNSNKTSPITNSFNDQNMPEIDLEQTHRKHVNKIKGFTNMNNTECYAISVIQLWLNDETIFPLFSNPKYSYVHVEPTQLLHTYNSEKRFYTKNTADINTEKSQILGYQNYFKNLTDDMLNHNNQIL